MYLNVKEKIYLNFISIISLKNLLLKVYYFFRIFDAYNPITNYFGNEIFVSILFFTTIDRR